MIGLFIGLFFGLLFDLFVGVFQNVGFTAFCSFGPSLGIFMFYRAVGDRASHGPSWSVIFQSGAFRGARVSLAGHIPRLELKSARGGAAKQ